MEKRQPPPGGWEQECPKCQWPHDHFGIYDPREPCPRCGFMAKTTAAEKGAKR